MTVTLELSPEREAALIAEAKARGLSVQQWLLQLAEQSASLPFSADVGWQDDRPIWEVIAENMKDVPPEEFAKLPKDGASEHDHYLYGHPKQKQ
jgi:hypothetical protein